MSKDSTSYNQTELPTVSKSLIDAPQKDSERLQMSPVYGTITTIILGVALMLLPSIAFAVFVQIVFAGMGKAESELVAFFESTIGQFVYMTSVGVLTVGFLMLILRFTNITWRGIGLSRPQGNVIAAFLKVLGLYFLALLVVNIALTSFTPIDVDQKQEIGFDDVTQKGQLLFVFVSLVVVPPIMEELVFRGFLYTRFKRYYSVVPAAIIVSLLFAFGHLQLDTGNPPLWIAAIDTFILSLALIYLREKTNSILPSIALHATKNFIAFSTLFLFSGAV